MYLNVFPMLSKGSFAKYFGGKEILSLLSDKSGSIISPMLLGSFVVFQLSFVLFKKYKFGEVMSGRRNTVTMKATSSTPFFLG